MDITIRTDRLVLKKLSQQDAADIVEAVSDPRVYTMIVSVPANQSLKATQSWIQATQDNWKAGSEFVYKIIFDEQFQGVVGLRQIEGSEDYNLGYWLSPQAWGKGYATECSRTLLEHFDAMQSGKKIVSGYFLDNLASGRVVSKLGFVKTGENTVFC